MTAELINALAAKLNADKLKAFANLTNYMNNPVGVGEHPDIVEECEKLIDAIATAEGKIEVLNQLLPKKPKKVEDNK